MLAAITAKNIAQCGERCAKVFQPENYRPIFMKITNVSHYVSVAGKEACVDNLHFIIEGAKFEALACAGDSLALRHYKNWLKSAEVEKPSHNKRKPK